MNILIVGGGGREHALAWKIAQSPLVERLYCAPGNPGIARHARCVELSPAPPFEPLVQWCRDHEISLVVVGPERPLAEGIVDALAEAGVSAFGPTRQAAQLEASKKFAKELMAEAGIPTAAARAFDDPDRALAHLDEIGTPCVIKAVGLAEGKGVTVARTARDAREAIHRAMRDRTFGEAGSEILIEQCLAGEEASLLAFADGRRVLPMASAQDHKPAFDGDEGPNTGGMGAYSPAPVLTGELYDQCVGQILEPCLEALRRRGIDYRGVIYAGLMITPDGPRVIEFNCRFGDPEIQALLPRLESDLVPVMVACAEGRLEGIELKWRDASAVCIVAASPGYPGPYKKGKPISGIERLPENGEVFLFHAGTALDGQGRLVTAGGRVLGLTVMDRYLSVAVERGYELLRHVRFDGIHYRSDIGRKALDRLKK